MDSFLYYFRVAEDLERNKRIVREALERIHAGDRAVYEQHPGYHATAQEIPNTLAAFPDLTFRVEQMIAEGDWVAYGVVRAGTQTGEFHGMRPTNKRAQWFALCMDQVIDGRVVHHRAIPDVMDLRRQLGI